MKLGGWHRLWIVGCVIYLVVVATDVIRDLQHGLWTFHIDEFYEKLDTESRKKIVSSDQEQNSESRNDVTRVEMPNGHIISFSSKLPQEELEKVSREYWDIVEKSAKEAKAKLIQRESLKWLTSCLAVYALGWSLAWVYRGFRKTY